MSYKVIFVAILVRAMGTPLVVAAWHQPDSGSLKQSHMLSY